MAVGPGIYLEKYKNLTLDELKKELEETQKYLNSEDLKEARIEEIEMGIDDNNCISNVETSISVLKKLIDNYYTKDSDKSQNDVSDESLKTIIEKVIGNNDHFWIELIKKIVLKIVEMEDGTESSINNLLDENNKFTSAQLFEIDKLVTAVCIQLNIKLDKSAYHNQTVGLPYNIPFIKRTEN